MPNLRNFANAITWIGGVSETISPYYGVVVDRYVFAENATLSDSDPTKEFDVPADRNSFINANVWMQYRVVSNNRALSYVTVRSD